MNASDGLEAQRRYARWLLWTTRTGAAFLAISFVLYASGSIAPYVPIDRLPSLWSLPARDFLREAHIPPGWHGWAQLAGHADMLVLCAVAVLIGSSILCLAAAIPVFWRRHERLLAAVCILQIVVLSLAAAGAWS